MHFFVEKWLENCNFEINALNNVLINRDYDIKEAIVFNKHNILTVGKITYLPIYMTMFLKPDYELKLPTLDLENI